MEKTIGQPLPLGSRLHCIKQGMTMTSRNGNINQIYEITSYDEVTSEYVAICVEDDNYHKSSKHIGRTLKLDDRWLARELTRPWNSGEFTLCNTPNGDSQDILVAFAKYIIAKYNIE